MTRTAKECVGLPQLGVDPDRVAVGGFSAGGLAAVNAVYGMGAPVKSVISLSGGIGGFDLRKTAKAGMAPAGTRVLLGVLGAAGVEVAVAPNTGGPRLNIV